MPRDISLIRNYIPPGLFHHSYDRGICEYILDFIEGKFGIRTYVGNSCIVHMAQRSLCRYLKLIVATLLAAANILFGLQLGSDSNWVQE